MTALSVPHRAADAATRRRDRRAVVTTLLVLTILLLLAGAAVFRPLLSAEFDAPSGPGREIPREPRGSRIKATVREECEDLKRALDEGKISRQDYEAEVARIKGIVGDLHPEPDIRGSGGSGRTREPAAYPVGAVVGWGGAALLTLGIAFIVERLDIIRPVAPASPGAAPVAEASPSGVPPVPDDFVPDIGAMVGQLEARILDGDVVEEDIEMLSRSYRVLGWEEDFVGFLQGAVERNPDNPVLLLALGIQLYGQPEPDSDREAEMLFDRILVRQPDHPVAHWYKSLVLARRGELDLALERLRLVQELVADDPRATSVVAELIARLTSPHESGSPENTEAR